MAALQRLVSSPAALATARSLAGLRDVTRPSTSCSATSYSSSHSDTLISADELLPCGNPAEDIQRVLSVLSAALLANRSTLDWQGQLQVRPARRTR